MSSFPTVVRAGDKFGAGVTQQGLKREGTDTRMTDMQHCHTGTSDVVTRRCKPETYHECRVTLALAGADGELDR